MKKLIYISYIIVMAISLLRYDFSVADVLIVVFNFFSFYIFFKKRNLRDNLAYLILWGYIFLSSTVVAAFQMWTVGFMYNNVKPPAGDFEDLAIFANRVMLFASLILIFPSKNLRNESSSLNNHFYIGKELPKRIPRLFICLAFFLTLLSAALGISDVEESKIILPFHLNGLIDELRRNIFPILFAVYIYDCLKKNRKTDKIVIVGFFLWAMLEMLVRVSKGAFLTSFLPVLLLLFIMGRFNKKTTLSVVLPILMIFLISYPIINTMRTLGDNSTQSFVEAYKMNKSGKGEGSSPYLRMFINGMDYLKVKSTVETDHSFFNFHRAPILAQMGGTAPYITYNIDGYSRDLHHSSGTTGIVDPLLWGGAGFCYLIVFLLSMLARFVDSHKLFREKLLYQLVMLFVVKTFVMQRSISFFFDNLFFGATVTIILEFLIVRLYYKYYA